MQQQPSRRSGDGSCSACHRAAATQPQRSPSSLSTLPSPTSPDSPPLLWLVSVCLLLCFLLLTSLPVSSSQAVPVYTLIPTQSGPAVASSSSDQGQLVLSRLRTRKGLQAAAQAAPGVFKAGARKRWGRAAGRPGDDAAAAVEDEDEDEQQREQQQEEDDGDVYECTSLEGPDCGFINGEEELSTAQLLASLIAQLVKQQRRQLRETEATDGEKEDGSVPLPDQQEAEEGEEAAEGDDAAADAETEYELVTVGEDGETRPLTTAEMAAIRLELEAGNVEIEWEDVAEDGAEEVAQEDAAEEDGAEEAGLSDQDGQQEAADGAADDAGQLLSDGADDSDGGEEQGHHARDDDDETIVLR